MTTRLPEGFRVGLAIMGLALGCSDPVASTSVAAKDYPRGCTTLADCFPVTEGPVGCCGLGCPNAAIRQDAVAAFMTAQNAAQQNACHGVAVPCALPPPCQGGGRVLCDNGVCILTSPADAATQ